MTAKKEVDLGIILVEKLEELQTPKPVMKMSVLKIAQSLKCGPRETDLFKNDSYDMTLFTNNVIVIKHREKEDTTFTSLANAQWWKEAR